MKYVILIANNTPKIPTDPGELEAWSKEIYAWYDKWGSAGKIPDGGHQLQAADQAKTIRNGEVTDGPFIEAKEVIGGYSVLEADSLDEAVNLASSWPGVSDGRITIEVRPVAEMDGM